MKKAVLKGAAFLFYTRPDIAEKNTLRFILGYFGHFAIMERRRR